MMIFDTPPTPGCHASTVCEVSPGVLLAAWFGGRDEGAKDVQIYLARFEAGKWSTPTVVGTEPGFPTWNPVLFVTAKKTLRLWYKAGPKPDNWTGYVRSSADGGHTWTTPVMLPAGFYGPVRAKPLLLSDGTLLAGTSVETHRCWTPYVDRSTDDGLTWTRSNAFNPAADNHNQIQPALAAGAGGTVVALMRSRNPRVVMRSISADNGRTWSPAEPTQVPNPSTGVDLARSADGTLWLVHNNTALGRTPLTLSKSADDGKTWAKAIDLESAPGEYSYPAMIANATGTFDITYTWKRTHIKHVTFDPKTGKVSG